jgi:hypothetical protein
MSATGQTFQLWRFSATTDETALQEHVLPAMGAGGEIEFHGPHGVRPTSCCAILLSLNRNLSEHAEPSARAGVNDGPLSDW